MRLLGEAPWGPLKGHGGHAVHLQGAWTPTSGNLGHFIILIISLHPAAHAEEAPGAGSVTRAACCAGGTVCFPVSSSKLCPGGKTLFLGPLS